MLEVPEFDSQIQIFLLTLEIKRLSAQNQKYKEMLSEAINWDLQNIYEPKSAEPKSKRSKSKKGNDSPLNWEKVGSFEERYKASSKKSPSMKNFRCDKNHDIYHSDLKILKSNSKSDKENILKSSKKEGRGEKVTDYYQKELHQKDREIINLCSKIRNIEKGFSQLKNQMNLS